MKTILLSLELLLIGATLCAQLPTAALRLEATPPNGVTRFAPQWRAPGQRKVALALRGGSAKGLAHIGVIQRFEEEGLPIDALSGTSAGSMMSALHATGYSGRQMQALFKATDFGALLDDRHRTMGMTFSEEEIRNANMLEFNLHGGNWEFMPGKERSKRVQQFLRILFAHTMTLPDHDFDKLRIPLRVVTSNLQTGEATVFSRGEVATAVRASMTLPALLAPAEHGGQQLMDGGFAENLPVFTSRKDFPDMLQVGVDIGRKWDESRVTNILGLTGRVLDVSMRQNEKRSLGAADLLISPNMDKADEFDFHNQVDELVRLGRVAFDEMLPQLEAQIYGPGGAVVVAQAPLVIGSPGLAGWEEVVKASVPAEGPIRRTDLYRLLRRLQQNAPLSEAWIEPPMDPSQAATLKVNVQAEVRSIEWQLPPDLPARDLEECRQILEASPLKTGSPFNAHAFDDLINALTIRTPWKNEAMLAFKGSGFDAKTGALRLVGEELRIKSILVAEGSLKKPMDAYLKRITEKRTSPSIFLKTLDHASVRFHLTELGESPVQSGPEGPVLTLKPKQDKSILLAFSPAYESNWGAHLGMDAQLQNSILPSISIGLHGAINSLQSRGSIILEKELNTFPGFSFGLYGNTLKQEFGTDVFLLTPLPGTGSLNIHRSALGLGLSSRFGERDTGQYGLRVEQERYDWDVPGAYNAPPEQDRTAQAFLEWDDLDFHTLPTHGTLFRIRGGASFDDKSEVQPFQFGYLRFTHLYTPEALGLGFQFDAEGAFGWNTPLPRWNIIGGSDSIIGTKGAAYLLPNIGILRLGMPFTSTVSAFGFSVQVVPRVDWGRFSAQPNELSSGARILGVGVLLRSIVQSFYVELALGQTQTRNDSATGTQKNTELTILIGTRPFDIWKQR